MLLKNRKFIESAPWGLKILWEEGFFRKWSSQSKISSELARRGNNFPIGSLRVALIRASHLTKRNNKGISEYIQKKPAIDKSIEASSLELFDDDLLKKLDKAFSHEIQDLYLNFGRSGNCSAFLLRKVLEKLIYICFAHKGLEKKLADKNGSGRLIGLDGMINLAALERVKGMPFLTSKTAQEIRGIKFLGDTSAHNSLVDVDMKTIVPQIPFIVTAYKELASFL